MTTITRADFVAQFKSRTLSIEDYLNSPAVKQALASATSRDRHAANAFSDAVRAKVSLGAVSNQAQAGALFDVIDTLDHNGTRSSIGNQLALGLLDQAKKLSAPPPAPPTQPTQPTQPGDASQVFKLGDGAQAMKVLSEYQGSGKYHNAPAGTPLAGMHGYAQETKDGEVAAQFTAKADYDSDGSSSFTDSGTHQDDTSMHFKVAGRATPVDGEKLPYVVLPPEIVEKTGAKLGDLVQVTFDGKSTFAIYADGGPKGKCGELSGATARACGITDDGNRRPINGNDGRDTQDVLYTVLAGSGAEEGIVTNGAPVTARDIQQKGLDAFLNAEESGLLV